nr:immunoglobulin heavy chain junction region [Macaca mulatta]MOV54022.1 immunoglobulin heavy chain junction region [Macaca mulatta]MOV54272.1 immunoglobulin heavy chain junction region [Macaca mulatta]MOV54490.1 immunoglobulin heavy chain junction region [Macaca mulatta]MOV54733.1 immunoglobulin heavy chain junction region [Macaca mulatta]
CARGPMSTEAEESTMSFDYW